MVLLLPYFLTSLGTTTAVNSFIYKDIMLLYITAKAFYKEGNYIIKNGRDLSI